MADETTSAVASPAPSTEQAPATSSPPPDSQQQASTPDKPAKVNLFEIPEFKQYQSQQNQLISRLQRQVQETEQQYQQRLAQLETRDMDESERRAYLLEQENARFRQELANREAMLQQTQANARKVEILSRISRKTQVPIEELYNFEDADDAWEYANDKALEREKKQLAAQQREARSAAAAAVDLGGGAANTLLNEWEAAIAEAEKRGDARAYARLLRERPG